MTPNNIEMPTNECKTFVRKLAIEYYLENENVTQNDVIKIFKISKSTFIRWLKQYNSSRNTKPSKRTAKSYKIKEKHVKYVIKVIEKNPQASIKILWETLKQKFKDFNISQGHLSEVIRDNNITRKRTTKRHFPETRYGKPIDLKKQLKQFYAKTDKWSLNKIICIDETSVYAQMPNNYSRCKLGKRCVQKTTNNKVFVKYTLVCAISSKGIVGWTLYREKGMSAIRMVEFISKFIKNKYKNHLIIMDNGGPHKSHLVKEAIVETKNQLQYSVPYKPKTNAIESFFSQLKHYLTLDKESISHSQLENSIKNALKNISIENYNNYMKYAYRNHKLQLKNIDNSNTRKRKPKIYKK